MKRFHAVSMILCTGSLIAMTAACGSSGSAGATGPQGPEGNANVQVDTFSLTNSQWQYNSQYSLTTSPGSFTEYFTRFYDAPFSPLTRAILDSGLVLAFFTPNTFNNTDQWAPLPYEFMDGTGAFTYNVVFETMLDSVRLHYFFVPIGNGVPPTLATYDIPTYAFKLIAVSGGTAAAMAAAHVDLKNYAAVSKFVGLHAAR
jgi:hypothetical protein